MPIKKSAKKYMRVIKRKTTRNKIVLGKLKNAIKKTKEAVAVGNQPEALNWLRLASKLLDKTAQKGIIKKKTASRKKSRLNRLVKSISSAPTSKE